MNPTKRPTIVDIANALGISISTVHRALNDHPRIAALTKSRVLQMARKLGYKPNLAARFLSSKRPFRISVNTLQGATCFWDDVRAGIEEERRSLDLENVNIEYRTFRLENGEQEAFQAALDTKAEGIIAFPSQPQKLRPLLRRAARQNVPVVFVTTDAPGISRLSAVSIDTHASGALAADLIGRIVGGRGDLGVTIFDANINEHAEKFTAFEKTVRTLYPNMRVHAPIQDHDDDKLAYEQCRRLLTANPSLVGLYVTTELSIPVIQAARDLGRLSDLTIVATDLFPALMDEIRSGAVTATVFQRPRTQGSMAFRVLYHYLSDGECPPGNVSFAPHLVMRGNLHYFLKHETGSKSREAAGDMNGRGLAHQPQLSETLTL